MNRLLEYLMIEDEHLNSKSKLIPFLCIYPFNNDIHNVVIYANNWAEAHTYANHHKLIVKEKLE